MLDAIEAHGVHRGYRRAHSRGVCVAGYFESNGAGERLSIASVLATGRTPFVGRMSIGGADPAGREPMARVRSMALELTQSDRQQWRMAMNSFPLNSVTTPEAFYEQTLAARPDPTTGKPVPAKLAAFDAAHPESAPFKEWAALYHGMLKRDGVLASMLGWERRHQARFGDPNVFTSVCAAHANATYHDTLDVDRDTTVHHQHILIQISDVGGSCRL